MLPCVYSVADHRSRDKNKKVAHEPFSECVIVVFTAFCVFCDL